MKKLFPTAVCAAMIGWAGVAGAITIENGSFETGTTGWITTIPAGSSGSVLIVGSTSADDGTLYSAPMGASFAEITATASIQQTGLNWSAGEQLTFYWAFLGFDEIGSEPDENFNDSAFFRVTEEGGNILVDELLSDIATVGPEGRTDWVQKIYNFTNSGSGSIEFGVTNVGGEEPEFSSKLLIDDVSSISVAPGPDPAPVPEPTTMLLFGAGLLGLAGFARRRGVSKA